jgi:hypothetical protein
LFGEICGELFHAQPNSCIPNNNLCSLLLLKLLYETLMAYNTDLSKNPVFRTDCFSDSILPTESTSKGPNVAAPSLF